MWCCSTRPDLVDAKELASVEARIASINPYATLHRTRRCNVLGKVLGKDAFNLDRILEFEPRFLSEEHEHEHDAQIASLALKTDQPMEPDKFVRSIEDVTQRFGADILRMKERYRHER